MKVSFRLNGKIVQTDAPPTTTLLDWLRTNRGLTGTKEGCNEGDCGACTVVMSDQHGHKAVNACIQFLPQIDGKSIRTVEGITGQDGALHPVQQAMIDHHGSQCGFCTPGIVASLAVAHDAGRSDIDTVLAGNLCRCTGYHTIRQAALAAQTQMHADWQDDGPVEREATSQDGVFIPDNVDDLADWYKDNPDATLVGGATDVALWVNKNHQSLPKVAFLNGLSDLQTVEETADTIRVGAGVTMTQLLPLLEAYHPHYAIMVKRFAAEQVRNVATIGGNIANGSPIGDNPPPLIALDAQLHLRHGSTRRSLPIEDFFVEYGQQDRAKGEFVEGVTLPKVAPNLRVYKISKRQDQDISTLLGAFNIISKDGHITEARIAFGGMTGTPKRATNVENALIGQPFVSPNLAPALKLFSHDYSPLSDMRGSAEYRLGVAQNLLTRYFADLAGELTSIGEVTL